MEKFNTDLRQVLKWLHNKAPNIQALINSKNDWYEKYNNGFWDNWYTDVFNLDTCNEFGIYVWCEILGVPKDKFVLEPLENAWAYGEYRKNYVASSSNTDPNREVVGGNFMGGGNEVITGIEEARLALKLRYAALISDGRLESINYMLNWIINKGEPYDFAAGKYFSVVDDSSTPTTGAVDLDVVSTDWAGEYHLRSNENPRSLLMLGNTPTIMSDMSNGWRFSGYLPGTTPGGTLPMGGGYTEAPDGTQSAIVCTKLQGVGSDTITFYSGVPSGKLSWLRYAKKRYTYICSMYLKAEPGFRFTIYPNLLSPNASNLTYSASGWTLAIQPDRSITFESFSSNSVNPKQNFIGWEYDESNGWYRIWTCIITNGNVVEPPNDNASNGAGGAIANYYAFAFSLQRLTPNTSGTTFSTWGWLCEELPYTGDSMDVHPGHFQYVDTLPSTFNATANQLLGLPRTMWSDYSVDSSSYPLTITFAASKLDGKPIIGAGQVVEASGMYLGYNTDGSWQIAVGDGNTFTYTIPEPPGFTGQFNQPMKMQYRIGPALEFSGQFIALISNRENGILPQNAGIPYEVQIMP